MDLEEIRAAALKRILFMPHAVRQMSRPDRMISSTEVREVVLSGSIIEDYPEDPRGRSALMLGQGSDSRAVHVVCAPKKEYLTIITAYIPDPEQWSADYRTRRK